MKYIDVFTGEPIDKFKTLYAEVKLNESSIGDEAVVETPFKLTNAKKVVVRDEKMEEELKTANKELNKIKLERRELKKEVKHLKAEIKKLNEKLSVDGELLEYLNEGSLSGKEENND